MVCSCLRTARTNCRTGRDYESHFQKRESTISRDGLQKVKISFEVDLLKIILSHSIDPAANLL